MSDVLAEILKLLGVVALPVAAYFVRAAIAAFEARTKIHLTDQQRAKIIGASERAGGIAYDYLASRAHGMTPEEARAAAFAAGVAFVRTSAADAIAALQVSSATVDDMVRGQLGKLLATDPAVTVAPALEATPAVPTPRTL